MGCTQSGHALPPNIPQQHINRLLQVADINHQLNVNKKYQYLSTISQSISSGEGLKKTFGYYCLTTKTQMLAKRKQFWETRVNGNPEAWNCLHAAVNSKTQQQMFNHLTRAKLCPLNNSIQMCVDSKGNKYEVPVFCINQPISYSSQKIADRNLKIEYDDFEAKIKIRTVKFPNQDIIMNFMTSAQISMIKDHLRQLKQLNDAKIRFFYGGRQMHDDKTLGNYGFENDTIIQAMIKE